MASSLLLVWFNIFTQHCLCAVDFILYFTVWVHMNSMFFFYSVKNIKVTTLFDLVKIKLSANLSFKF